MQQTKQSAGGIATAKLNRSAALARYYTNPNHCKHCNAMIRVAEKQRCKEVRRKKFCSHSCAAAFNTPRREPKGPRIIECERCAKPFAFVKKYSGATKRRFCDACYKHAMIDTRGHLPVNGTRTKGELFSSRRNWQSARSTIRKHAAKTFYASGRPMTCEWCGYTHYIEICHRRSVASFDGTATLDEINHPTNLTALCPNHHWEFDNGLLQLGSAGRLCPDNLRVMGAARY